MKGKYVETKFEKSSVIRQPNAFKSQRQSILGKPATFSDSLAKTDFSKSKSVTTQNVSHDFSKPVTAQILPQNVLPIFKNTNVIAPGMYKVHTKPNQTRTPWLPQDIRKTNKCVSFSIGVIPTTSVSRPQLKSNQLEDRVMSNNSQGKKQEVEDHRRNFKFSNNKTSVTACNDSLNAKTSNVNFVCVTCGKCVLNDNHDLCVLHYINGVNSRTRQPIVVPISTREPKHNVNQSVATSSKKTIATDSTVKQSRNITRKLYEQVSKTCSWWYPKYTPTGYNWKPKSQIGNVNQNVSMPLGNASRNANILDHKTPRCSTVSNTPLSSNSFAARTVKFGNDQIAPILGYGDLAKATSSQAWLWHRCLSHLNFDTINLLSKNNMVEWPSKAEIQSRSICVLLRVGESKKEVKDETPGVLIDFLTLVQRDFYGSVTTNGENLDKMKEKGDACIFVGYSTQSKAYRMVSDYVSSDPGPQCSTTALEQDSLSPGPQILGNVPQVTETVITSNELELLYSLMFSELLNGTSPVVSKSSAVHAADNPDKPFKTLTTTNSTNNNVQIHLH
ncbi:retrovirus-related pol polyprotein from transposon TNT 1-94 [Tanacetum coccineum]